MKYFRVEEECISACPVRYEVGSDGEQIGESYGTSDIMSITLGYNVFIEGGDGITESVEFYPVETDMETFDNNSVYVLEKIKRDFPAREWENNNW